MDKFQVTEVPMDGSIKQEEIVTKETIENEKITNPKLQNPKQLSNLSLNKQSNASSRIRESNKRSVMDSEASYSEMVNNTSILAS